MQKIVIVILFLIIFSGCSVTKNKGGIDKLILPSENTLDNAEYQNISNNGFFIQKAEIEVITAEGKDKFIATIKFVIPGKYLISIKSRTGIEGARIYITKDSVLVNDRINKKLYSGSARYLRLKYGVDQNLLPLVFGDIILDAGCRKSNPKCKDDKVELKCPVKGTYLSYTIDCKTGKTNMVNFEEQGINVIYDDYFLLNNIITPRSVVFNSSKLNTTIKINVVKVEYPWNGNVSFVPGRDYELIELK